MSVQMMIFTVGDQRYAVELSFIREIITYRSITRMPDSPPWVIGIVETRSQAMPIIDLRIRFQTDLTPIYHDKTVIIATKLTDGKLLGLVVDSVEDIGSFSDQEIISGEKIETRIKSSVVKGYIEQPANSILILDHLCFAEFNAIPSLVENAHE